MLWLLRHQDSYFNLGLGKQIDARCTAFSAYGPKILRLVKVALVRLRVGRQLRGFGHMPKLYRTFHRSSPLRRRRFVGIMSNGRRLEVGHPLGYGSFNFRCDARRRMRKEFADKQSEYPDTVFPNLQALG
jgi:hypothetical protein